MLNLSERRFGAHMNGSVSENMEWLGDLQYCCLKRFALWFIIRLISKGSDGGSLAYLSFVKNIMAYTTRQSLLDAMRRNENTAWVEFGTVYGPLVRLIARKNRLTVQESKELMQDVCVTMIQREALSKYDAGQGHFRTYLGRIISNCAIDIIRRRPKRTTGSTQRLETVKDESSGADDITSEWDDFILQQALSEVRSRCDDLTYLAFEFHVRQGRPAKEVAKELGISEDKVYLSSSRIVRRLKDAVERLNEELDLK